jgi:prefoldin subunit 5
MIIKRLLGLVVILTALLGIGLSGGIYWYGHQAIDIAVAQTDGALAITVDTLKTTQEVLEVAKTSLNDVSSTLVTVESTTDNLAQTIRDTEPLLNQIDIIATEQIPDSLQTFNDVIPNIATVAGTVDNTLSILSAFGFERNLDYGLVKLGTIRFDLGIDYNPTVRFDESILQLGASIEELPAQLRTLDTHLAVTNNNLLAISDDIETLGTNISDINATIETTPALLDEYMGTLDTIQGNIGDAQQEIQRQVGTAKLVVTVLAVWFGLIQIAFLYLGFEMLFNKRKQVIVEYYPVVTQE